MNFYQALLALKNVLVEREGVYGRFRSSYLREAEACCAYNFHGIDKEALNEETRVGIKSELCADPTNLTESDAIGEPCYRRRKPTLFTYLHKAENIVQCWKENGFVHTLRRIKEELT